MPPHATFMVVAPLDPHRVAGLRAMLAGMNHRPGVVNPQNPLVPFGQLERLHFARFVILDDQTLDDISVYRVPPNNHAISLAFLGDCDGPAHEFLVDLIDRARDGLRQIFSHCRDFPGDSDLLAWMQAHEQRPAAVYVNWVGRSVRQIREESALRDALQTWLDGNGEALQGKGPQEKRDALRRFVETEIRAGRLTLTPRPSRFAWRVENVLHGAGVLLILGLLAPLLLLYAPIFVLQLRRRERRDPEITPRPDAQRVACLAALEDHDVTNQFSAIGTIKPGWF